MGVISIFI